MLAIHRTEHTSLALRSTTHKPTRASIGARRNPASTRAILEAAEVILRRDGLAGFSMDAIARLAQSGKPTLYRWWPDKASLLADIHGRALPAFVSSQNGSKDDRIDQLAARWVAAWRTTLAGVALRGMLAEAQLSTTAHTMLIQDGLSPYRAALAECVPSDEVEMVLSQTLVPLLGELMLQNDSSGSVAQRDRRPVMRSASGPAMRVITAIESRFDTETAATQPVADPSRDPEASTLRHRGEWVD